jgi:nucleotide-binding universal stress UspA family protein
MRGSTAGRGSAVSGLRNPTQAATSLRACRLRRRSEAPGGAPGAAAFEAAFVALPTPCRQVSLRSPPGSILCATDLSPQGNVAVQVAYGLARSGTVVHLLHVAEPSLAAALHAARPGNGPSPSDLAEAERRASVRLARLVPAASAREGVRTEMHVVHDVEVADRILAEAKAVDAEVIVLGTHGQTGIGRILMGSVASSVMRRTEAPVVMASDRAAG